ncbi:hypothetical protein HX13_12810 [Chryseobacterium sp. P1-3]|nr:hypothetical protein HX13_12810 [Chryseobacterium sp. P1-3]
MYQDVRLSYHELNERANRLANHLIETYGLQPDDIVPLCLNRSEQMLIAILAVLKSGAAYVPMDPSYPADRIEHILQDTAAKNHFWQKKNTSEKVKKYISRDYFTGYNHCPCYSRNSIFRKSCNRSET